MLINDWWFLIVRGSWWWVAYWWSKPHNPGWLWMIIIDWWRIILSVFGIQVPVEMAHKNDELFIFMCFLPLSLHFNTALTLEMSSTRKTVWCSSSGRMQFIWLKCLSKIYTLTNRRSESTCSGYHVFAFWTLCFLVYIWFNGVLLSDRGGGFLLDRQHCLHQCCDQFYPCIWDPLNTSTS